MASMQSWQVLVWWQGSDILHIRVVSSYEVECLEPPGDVVICKCLDAMKETTSLFPTFRARWMAECPLFLSYLVFQAQLIYIH